MSRYLAQQTGQERGIIVVEEYQLYIGISPSVRVGDLNVVFSKAILGFPTAAHV